MRYTAPINLKKDGKNVPKEDSLNGVARVFLGKMIEINSSDPIGQKWTRRLSDGSIITGYIPAVGMLPVVTVTSPPPKLKEPIEDLCTRGIVVTPVSDDALTGWINPLERTGYPAIGAPNGEQGFVGNTEFLLQSNGLGNVEIKKWNTYEEISNPSYYIKLPNKRYIWESSYPSNTVFIDDAQPKTLAKSRYFCFPSSPSIYSCGKEQFTLPDGINVSGMFEYNDNIYILGGSSTHVYILRKEANAPNGYLEVAKVVLPTVQDNSKVPATTEALVLYGISTGNPADGTCYFSLCTTDEALNFKAVGQMSINIKDETSPVIDLSELADNDVTSNSITTTTFSKGVNATGAWNGSISITGTSFKGETIIAREFNTAGDVLVVSIETSIVFSPSTSTFAITTVPDGGYKENTQVSEITTTKTLNVNGNAVVELANSKQEINNYLYYSLISSVVTFTASETGEYLDSSVGIGALDVSNYPVIGGVIQKKSDTRSGDNLSYLHTTSISDLKRNVEAFSHTETVSLPVPPHTPSAADDPGYPSILGLAYDEFGEEFTEDGYFQETQSTMDYYLNWVNFTAFTYFATQGVVMDFHKDCLYDNSGTIPVVYYSGYGLTNTTLSPPWYYAPTNTDVKRDRDA